MRINSRFLASIKVFAIHFCASLVLVSIVAVAVLGIWFPYPFVFLAGGLYLLGILVAIDVICGPVLTAILFNPKKSKKELALDLTLVVILQIAALAYGLHTISGARPVRLVFEVDRFVAVSAAEIDASKLKDALPQYRQLGWRGPELVGTRSAKNSEEFLESVSQSIQGLEPSLRPDWWQDYSLSQSLVRKKMVNVAKLIKDIEDADEREELNESIRKTKKSVDDIYYLPMVARKSTDDWIVLLDQDGDIVGYAAVNGFR